MKALLDDRARAKRELTERNPHGTPTFVKAYTCLNLILDLELSHFLAFLIDSYEEQKLEGGKERTVLHLHPDLAPVKVAVIPLARNKPDMVQLAKRIKKGLQSTGQLRSLFDDSGNIGKCYARQDEIGTPFCVTVDHESLEDNAVTVRDRDTWEQERVATDSLREYLQKRLS